MYAIRHDGKEFATRHAEDDVVTQFSDSEDENHDVQIETPTDNTDHASAKTSHFYSTFISVFRVLLLLSFIKEQYKRENPFRKNDTFGSAVGWRVLLCSKG